MSKEFDLPDNRLGIILDYEDIVRGCFQGTGDPKENIKALEGCLSNEYCTDVKLQKIEYHSYTDTYELTVHIWDNKEGGLGSITDFRMQKALLYAHI